MRIIKRDLQRRTIIEKYARYDLPKKGHPIPDFATWNWSEANAIDTQMELAHLKTGIPAGYLLWDEIEITMPDLLECAVESRIFPGQSRKLGRIDVAALTGWKSRPENLWYTDIKNGITLSENAPMLIRPAVRRELPASWYIEDGSGRAIAFVANQPKFDSSQTLAIGYLGRKPDPQSNFMQKNFQELL